MRIDPLQKAKIQRNCFDNYNQCSKYSSNFLRRIHIYPTLDQLCTIRLYILLYKDDEIDQIHCQHNCDTKGGETVNCKLVFTYARPNIAR